jgi:hypothetical protein
MAGINEAVKYLQVERDRLQAEADRIAAELQRVTKAIAALEANPSDSQVPSRKRGRPPGSKLSPEARAKIAAAQRARWAKAKAQG